MSERPNRYDELRKLMVDRLQELRAGLLSRYDLPSLLLLVENTLRDDLSWEPSDKSREP